MKRIDYFWHQVLCQITGIVFFTQLFFELSGIGTRKQGFEWVIYACAAAFIAALLYAGAAISINAWRSWRGQCRPTLEVEDDMTDEEFTDAVEATCSPTTKEKMNQRIIELAKAAGCLNVANGFSFRTEQLQTFVALVRAEVLEEAAKLVDCQAPEMAAVIREMMK